ncbi:hypothetical protein V1512DRAFT_277777 [Lipomyces arxii]|uniref:uncharacterized protein n=1 Tax=Lipomyces arxii TaxID=56418 RepID=UPI0034CFAB4A
MSSYQSPFTSPPKPSTRPPNNFLIRNTPVPSLQPPGTPNYFTQRTTRLPSAFPASPPRKPQFFQQTKAPSPRVQSTERTPAAIEPRLLPPLIPESYVDVGSQRLYAISLFLLIQAWKLYDLTQLHRDGGTDAELTFAFKYLFIEGLYIFALPVLRIPWLTFSPTVTIMQIVICSVWTIFLSSASALPISAFVSAAWKAVYDRELSISEHRVRAKDVVQKASHISGRHIVHILPESTARFNPEGQAFCIDSETQNTVYLPIRLNATEPNLIQVYHVRYNDTSYSTLNFTKKELRKFTEDVSDARSQKSKTKMLEVKLPVKETGLYRLQRIVDTTNLDVKLYQVDVMVSQCPRASIRPDNKDSVSVDRCIGDHDAPSMVVDGVPPLRVKYSRSIKGRDALFSVQSIQPDHFVSPLLQSKHNRYGRVWHSGETLEWALPRNIDISLDTNLGTVGKWSYMIDEVEDGLGNLVNYTSIYADKDREESPDLEKKGLNYGFLVHPRPSIRFSSCSAEQPVNLAKGRSVDVPLQLGGTRSEGPYSVDYVFTPVDGHSSPQFLKADLRPGREMLPIGKPGTYVMEKLRGQYCEGDILESSTCLALTPSEPTVAVKFEDIEDKCAGSIGVTADLTFTGTPPFELRYNVIKDKQDIKMEKLVVRNTRHQLQFRPDSAGHYTYEFLMLGDSLYTSIILDRRQFRTEQTVKVLASATFAEGSLSKRCCTGDSADFDVNFHGSGPFTLTYEILHGNKRKQQVVSDIEGPTRRFTTAPLTNGGSYTVILLSIEDGNGCKNTLSVADARIEVRRQRPTAKFIPIEGKMSSMTLKGQVVNIPLALSGEAPWSVTYAYTSRTNVTSLQTVSVRRANGDSIQAREEGTYEIMDAADAYCPGAKIGSTTFELSWFEQPRLRLVESPLLERKDEATFVRRAICEGDEDNVEVALYGSPPFAISYEREYNGPDKSVKVVKYDLEAVTKYANIPMEASKFGDYKYLFSGIVDSVYSNPRIVNEAFTPITIKQAVFQRPEASFVNPGTVYRSCLRAEVEDGSIDPIMIKLVGIAPFTLALNVKHENSGQMDTITITNINDNLYALRSIYSSLGIGRHLVNIAVVTDSRGCLRNQFRSTQQVVVSVSDVPTISPSTPRMNYCVGERIAFVLTGMPPFEIEYEFNGRRQRATTNSPFSRLASTPGNFTITSVKDSASNCKVFVHGDLTKIVHDVPTVRVSEGTSIIQDIHEGDRAEIVFHLSGTPPFTFTYTRSERVGRSSRERVLETHTISDVHENSYSIFTSMEGAYEAISVEDRYCRARVGS